MKPRTTSLALSLLLAGLAYSQDAAPAPATAAPKQATTPTAPRRPMPQKPGVPGVQRPIAAVKPQFSYSVEGVPDWLAIDEFIWVSNKPKNTVSRLDPKTGKVMATIPVGAKPCAGLAIGFGSLWVPNCGDNTISRVDLKTDKVVATIPAGIAHTEGCIATSPDSVWMPSDAKGLLLRIDPADNRIVAEIQVPEGSYCAAYGEDSVWLTSTEKNVLTRIDPRTNLIKETIEVGKKPRFLTVGEKAVWTLNQEDGSVTRVDPKTNKVEATITVGVPGGGGDISAADGSVWVTAFTIPISRIDPATNKVVQQFTGDGGDAIRAGKGMLFVSNLRAATVWKVDPKSLDEL